MTTLNSVYHQIQEKIEEQVNIRTLLSQTQEDVKKAITQVKEDNNSSRLSSLKDLKQKINDLSQQFEYGKLYSEKAKNEIIVIKNQIKELSKKRYIINQEIFSQDPIKSIKEYKELLDIGVITEQKFKQKNKDLLKQI